MPTEYSSDSPYMDIAGLIAAGDYAAIDRLRVDDQARALEADAVIVRAMESIERRMAMLQSALRDLRLARSRNLDAMSILWLAASDDFRAQIIQSFWENIEVRGQCHEWTGRRSSKGYGVFFALGLQLPAHRFSWMLKNGPIPADFSVCHTCDNPPCVGQDHLWLGTTDENYIDCVVKGRSKLGLHWMYTNPELIRHGEQCPGAKLSDTQVHEIRAFYAEHHPKQAWLAKKYGVSRATINGIVRGKRRSKT